MTNQLFFDRDVDSFLAEVGQILKITEIHIDIAENGWLRIDAPRGHIPNPNWVKISFAGREPTTGELIRIVELGRSYGEALWKVREEIIKETGR